MRLKKKPQAEGYIQSSPLCFNGDLDEVKGQILSWSKNHPLFLEIGCGKGRFLGALCRAFPDNYYLGIEQYDSVIYTAIRDASKECCENLRFLCERAENLSEIFPEDSVSGIYLNFSDPWPKKRHAKRRLTSQRFLSIYHDILIPDALIIQKTDNHELYKFSLEQFNLSEHFELVEYTDNLYAYPELLKSNFPTEYEEKFHQKGQPIHRIVARHKNKIGTGIL